MKTCPVCKTINTERTKVKGGGYVWCRCLHFNPDKPFYGNKGEAVRKFHDARVKHLTESPQ